MNMTDVYFHCPDDGQVLSATRDVAIVVPFEHADRIVRSYVMMASVEDWAQLGAGRHRRSRQ